MKRRLKIASYHFDPIHKVRLINVLRDYLKCDLIVAQDILKPLLEGEEIVLELDLPIE